MLQHLRRHVLRASEPFAIGFLNNPDTIRIASEMRSNRAAMVAFAEMLWSARMEQHVMLRRLPYRKVEQGSGGDYVGQIEPPCVSLADGGGVRKREELHHWVQYQACRCMMLSHWRESQRRAVEAVRSGVADRTITLGGDVYRWSTVRADQSIHFVALESQDEWGWTPPRPDKARRREEHQSAADLRLRHPT